MAESVISQEGSSNLANPSVAAATVEIETVPSSVESITKIESNTEVSYSYDFTSFLHVLILYRSRSKWIPALI